MGSKKSSPKEKYHNAPKNFQLSFSEHLQKLYKSSPKEKYYNAPKNFPLSFAEQLQMLGLRTVGVNGVFNPRVGGVQCSVDKKNQRQKLLRTLKFQRTWIGFRKILLSIAHKVLQESLQVCSLGTNLKNILNRLGNLSYDQYVNVLPTVLDLVCTFEGDNKGNINLSNVIEKAISLSCMMGC